MLRSAGYTKPGFVWNHNSKPVKEKAETLEAKYNHITLETTDEIITKISET